MKNKNIMVLMILVIALLLTSCNNEGQQTNIDPVVGVHNGMGTRTDFTVFGKNAEKAIEKGKEIMIDIEQKMSLSIDSSEVNQINKQAGIEPVKVSADTFEVVKRGLYFSELTNGSFDITIAPISKLWNIGQQDERVPAQEEIEEKLPLVNYKNVKIDEENQTVFLEKQGMEIDLGGIAKGYAADRIIESFKELGIEDALISVGGNIKVIGENAQKKRQWKVGLRHPREARGSYFATIDLQDGETVVSSGDYERYFMMEGTRYHHIFDAKFGKPSESDVIGVSIVTDKSMDADGLSTSVFVLGSQEGLNMIEEMKGVEAIIITKDLKVIATEGITNRLEIDKMQL